MSIITGSALVTPLKKWLAVVFFLMANSTWGLVFAQSRIESPPPSGFRQVLNIDQARFCIYESVRVQYMVTILNSSNVYNSDQLGRFISVRDIQRRNLCAGSMISDTVETLVIKELKFVRAGLRDEALNAISKSVAPTLVIPK